MKKVMVFGVFDGVHEGHRYFFREAKKFGDQLIVVVANDESVKKLKGKFPKAPLADRMRNLGKENIIDQVVIGDEDLDVWTVVQKYQPEIIALGYDQQLLKESLEKRLNEFGWKPEIKLIDSYQPEKYHSTLIASRNLLS